MKLMNIVKMKMKQKNYIGRKCRNFNEIQKSFKDFMIKLKIFLYKHE